MNVKSQATKLAEFLALHKSIWDDEIMHEWPESESFYPVEWIETLDKLTDLDLHHIDCKNQQSEVFEKLEGTSFLTFLKQVIELSAIPFIPEYDELPLENWAFHGVKKKKRHEIQKITPVLKILNEKKLFDYVVDIGGGVGHLSRVLAHYHSIRSVSMDQNTEFQEIGKARLLKFRKLECAKNVEFVNLTFGRSDQSNDLKNIFKSDSFSIGLHTCGPLANTLIKNSLHFQNAGLLSFGCCYHRLNPDLDFPLSKFYADNKFPKLNLYALSLATRSHAQDEFDVYLTKVRVKYYRYALHLFLMRNFGNKFFTDVGECPIKIYWEPFASYIRPKLAELNLEHHYSDDDFNTFYNDPKMQNELRRMFICNIIRWLVGRPLEVYLLLDRVIYLQEEGYHPKIEQYFLESLSPRNIGILALKNPI